MINCLTLCSCFCCLMSSLHPASSKILNRKAHIKKKKPTYIWVDHPKANHTLMNLLLHCQKPSVQKTWQFFFKYNIFLALFIDIVQKRLIPFWHWTILAILHCLCSECLWCAELMIYGSCMLFQYWLCSLCSWWVFALIGRSQSVLSSGWRMLSVLFSHFGPFLVPFWSCAGFDSMVISMIPQFNKRRISVTRFKDNG